MCNVCTCTHTYHVHVMYIMRTGTHRIIHVMHFHQKVLACAPSNIAVDNIVEKLSRFNSKVCKYTCTHMCTCISIQYLYKSLCCTMMTKLMTLPAMQVLSTCAI